MNRRYKIVQNCLVVALFCAIAPLYGMYEAVLNQLQQDVFVSKKVKLDSLSKDLLATYLGFYEKAELGKYLDYLKDHLNLVLHDYWRKKMSPEAIKQVKEKQVKQLLTEWDWFVQALGVEKKSTGKWELSQFDRDKLAELKPKLIAIGKTEQEIDDEVAARVKFKVNLRQMQEQVQ